MTHKDTLGDILEDYADWAYSCGVESSDGYQTTDWDRKKIHKKELDEAKTALQALLAQVERDHTQAVLDSLTSKLPPMPRKPFLEGSYTEGRRDALWEVRETIKVVREGK